MNRLIIRTNANKKIGFGHLIRCLALSEYLKKEFHIIFVLNKTDKYFYDLIKKKGIEIIELPEIQQYLPDEKESNNEIDFDLKSILKDSDYVILDGYRFKNQYRTSCKEMCHKLICIEDFPNDKYPVDVIICPSPIKFDFDTVPSTQIFNGIDNFILRSDFFVNLSEVQKKDVVISFGGNDVFKISKSIIVHLLEKTDFLIKLIYTDLFDSLYQRELVDLANKNSKRLELHKNCSAKEMNQLFRNSKFGFFTASTTLIEAIHCGMMPYFGYLANNQKKYYEFFNSIYTKNGLGNLLKLNVEKIRFSDEIIEFNFKLKNENDWVNLFKQF